jgi:GAF domain-containing protein
MMPTTLRPLMPRIIQILGDRPVIFAPLLLSGQALGVLNVTGHWLRPDDIPMVAALADHVAIALGHVRSQAEMGAALGRERLLNQMAEAVSGALELPEVLQRVVRLAAEMTDADYAAISLLEADGKTLGLPYLHGLPPEARFKPGPRGEGLIWRVIDTRQPVQLDDYASDPSALPAWVEAGVHAFLGLPLTARGEIIGAMGLFAVGKESSFGGQLEIAGSLACRARGERASTPKLTNAPNHRPTGRAPW